MPLNFQVSITLFCNCVFYFRYLGHLKSYVRNKAELEGSIVKGYLAEEYLTFCSRYLEGIEIRFNRLGRVDDQPTNNESSQVSTFFTEIGK